MFNRVSQLGATSRWCPERSSEIWHSKRQCDETSRKQWGKYNDSMTIIWIYSIAGMVWYWTPWIVILKIHTTFQLPNCNELWLKFLSYIFEHFKMENCELSLSDTWRSSTSFHFIPVGQTISNQDALLTLNWTRILLLAWHQPDGWWGPSVYKDWQRHQECKGRRKMITPVNILQILETSRNRIFLKSTQENDDIN